ncbi:TIGR03560 family F420-dependent LLM class oxidoreductase [Dactylosporangium sp. NPDC050688]|uniref:TIGR03560 family F420-dependent LLM class oxidoreductase n=1 Tax=Dactylosporangium sp. NPDC050688 TaxID=3157217 RepID=UPI0033D6E2A3
MDFRVFVEPQLAGASYRQQLATAQVAEDLGYDGFFRSDHYLPEQAAGQAQPPAAGATDSWLTLAGIARETRSIRLGTLMSAATLRLPGQLAIQVAQVDDMSDGRVELGLGTGWHEAEHLAYGVPFPAQRFDRFEEQLRIVTGLLGADAPFDFDGEHYRLRAAPPLPSVRQRPRPPVIVGGRGRRRTPLLAAHHADEFNIAFVRPDQAVHHFELVRQACREIGRDAGTLTYSAALVVCCGTSDAEVTARANRVGRGAAELRATGLAGSPAELVDKLGRYAEAGVQRCYLQFLDGTDFDHLELVAQQVVSQLR